MMSGEETKVQSGTSGVVKQSAALQLEEVKAGTATQMQVLIGPKDGASSTHRLCIWIWMEINETPS
jgi:hypothetical protein